MDKNAIKKYAVWARNELIARVSQKAQQYGITAEGYSDRNADSVNGVLLSATEKKQRQALIAKIDAEGFEQVMEEVAYTWFNRFTALRFMEVNNYLPSHTRVFTNEANEFKPQILADAISLELEGLDMDKVFELKDANKDEELYKYLLIVQCNALSSILPGMFQKIADYTELLLPDYLLREGSIVEQMISLIPEDNFDMNTENGQVEIIGWLYQYYISEKHEEVVDPLHGKVVKKEEVPAATQLFTTDWVVRYIVDNSVGRYWIERNPQSRLDRELKYYVSSRSDERQIVNETIKPQDLTVFDPCVGSGHFAVYAFEVLMKIYVEYGYSEREAAAEIVANNIFGLDIDGRAAQLAYFAIMMKARQYDRRFFQRQIQPQIYEITESNGIDKLTIDYFCDGKNSLEENINKVLFSLKDAKEYGSIIQMPDVDYSILVDRLEEIRHEISMFKVGIDDIDNLVNVCRLLSKKYAVVATNPPYLNKYDDKLKEYINLYYKDYSGDLFSVFIYRNFSFCVSGGYSGFMTPFVWMFIQTYEKLREYIIRNKSITSLIQMEYSAFEEATVPICSFVLKNGESNEKSYCFRLSDFKGGMAIQDKKVLEALENKNCGYFYEADKTDFFSIPGMPIAYWVSKKVVEAFSNQLISNIAFSDGQILTGNNNKYLRNVWEVNACDVEGHKRWALHAKGGEYRRWYGNIDTVVSWTDSSINHYKKDKIARFPKEHILFREGITWSLISSSDMFGMRLLTPDTTFNKAAATILFNDNTLIPYVLGYLNSVVARTILKMLNPTLNTNIKDILALPIIIDSDKKSRVEELVSRNIEISKEDWNSFETSWDFCEHPFIGSYHNMKEAYSAWEQECSRRFEELKANEEEINRIFIEIYGLQEELSPTVLEQDVTVRLADVTREVKSFISYAVGCMFGRYSLDSLGIAYGGGNKFDLSEYSKYIPDADNIIPICDDEYFADDIVGMFVNFVKTIFGENTLEENLVFVASAIGGKGAPRDVIRSYFLNEFFDDHIKTYQKRPIYWLFDSGKKNGFKCLIYMHRYMPDTIARIRTDYVHEQQSRYRTSIAAVEQKMNSASTNERVKLSRELKTLQEQSEEIRKYEEKIHHLADQMVQINIDDGVKSNYEIFKDVLYKIK